MTHYCRSNNHKNNNTRLKGQVLKSLVSLSIALGCLSAPAAARAVIMPEAVDKASTDEAIIAAVETGLRRKGWPWSTRRRGPVSDDNDLGRPTSRRGGQGRNPSDCLSYPVALVPGDGDINLQTSACSTATDSENNYAAAPAYTTAQQATLWVFVPAYNKPGLTAKVTLIDNWREQSSWEIPVQSTAGIMCFDLPYSLELDNVYAWEFEVLLTPNDAAANPKVSGFIAYTQQASEYWYDTLKTAIQQRAQLDSSETLVNLLAPHGLSSLADSSFAEQCQ